MRYRFEQQLRVGYLAINDIHFPRHFYKSRDEQPAVMIALHHIFTTPEINEAVFSILEKKIKNDKKATGRKGMDLWQLFVLSVLRHALNCNWDRLLHIANSDQQLRQLLGVHTVNNSGMEPYEFKHQTIIDNVGLIDEDTLAEINQVVADLGYELLKKKENETQRMKTDSYSLEKNIHFPTDLNLLYDSMRKCFDTIEQIQQQAPLAGWRKIKSIRRDYKSTFRATNQIVFKGKKEDVKKKQVKLYLNKTANLLKRFESIPHELMSSSCYQNFSLTLLRFQEYIDYVKNFSDQIERRLINAEVIPSEEKIYSIFEPETEWITKGKQNKRVELGHLVLVTTNQYHLIVDYKIMEKEKDAAQVKPLLERLTQRYPGQIESFSWDKGFYSKTNHEDAVATGIPHIVMPKRGRKNAQEQERENTKTFKQLRNEHSAIESSINMIEHHGGNRCPDKGHKHYKKYFGLCILATNLHLIGNELIRQAKEKEKEKEKEKQRIKLAA